MVWWTQCYAMGAESDQAELKGARPILVKLHCQLQVLNSHSNE